MRSKRLSADLKGPLGARNNERDEEARLPMPVFQPSDAQEPSRTALASGREKVRTALACLNRCRLNPLISSLFSPSALLRLWILHRRLHRPLALRHAVQWPVIAAAIPTYCHPQDVPNFTEHLYSLITSVLTSGPPGSAFDRSLKCAPGRPPPSRSVFISRLAPFSGRLPPFSE